VPGHPVGDEGQERDDEAEDPGGVLAQVRQPRLSRTATAAVARSSGAALLGETLSSEFNLFICSWPEIASE
jgi:hypothetical protein